MSLLDEVGTHLQTAGIGTLGTDLFLGFSPDAPDAVTVLYEAGGQAPIRAMGQAAGLPVAQRPRLQVVCRDNALDYADARSKAKSVYAILDGLCSRGDVTLSGVVYKWFAAVAEPTLMGRDDAGRVLIVVSYDVIKDPS